MNRADLQKLSATRIREAETLLAAGEHGGAYYLSGYAVECALKACFATTIQKYDFPDKSHSREVFTHKLKELANLANLAKQIEAEGRLNFKFEAGWQLVCRWTEESRYFIWNQSDAEGMIDAITRRRDGLLPWIKRRW